MNKPHRYLTLSGFELSCISLLSLAIIVAGNARFFLAKIGLIDSSAVLQSQLSHHVGSGLQTVDSFQSTPAIITFVTWSVIGLVTFSIIQAVASTSQAVKFERDLSSNKYVHPLSFSRDRYWKRIAIDTALSFVLLVLLIIAVILFFVAVIPVSLDYMDRFLLAPSIRHSADLLVGVVTVFAGTLVVYYVGKLVIWHHHLARQ